MTLKLLVGVLVVFAAILEATTSVSPLVLAGLLLVFAGERFFHEDATYWGFVGGGFVVLLAAIGLRVRRMMAAQAARKAGEQRALVFALVATSSLLLYGLTTDTTTAALGLTDDGRSTWNAVWGSLWPIVMMAGAFPMMWIDRALANHPVMLPVTAAYKAMEAGLAAALGIALLFPLNYVASKRVWDYDTSYFKVTDPGESTLKLAATLDEPIEAVLFFPPGSDVLTEVAGYFRKIEAQSGGKLAVTVTDQAVDPKLAEDMKVRENGYIALKKGDQIEKFKIGIDMDKAKRDLKKLDETVQKNLLKVARGNRTAYLLVGHGEASSKEKEDPLRKLNTFKQRLEQLNYKIKTLGVMDGSADAIPDDAAFLVIAAPEQALMPEEITAIQAYVQRGGSLWIMVEPGGDRLPELLAWLGLEAGTFPVANKKYYVPQGRGPADYVLIATNRYGTHAVTSTLSKFSTQAFVLTPTATTLTETVGNGKRTVLLRSPEGTWIDANKNFEQDADEASETFTLMFAVEGDVANPTEAGPKQWRALVQGDVSAYSDPALAGSDGNNQLVLDAGRWLVGDEEISGKVESEEDVKLEHTKDDDIAWFWGTIFGVPGIVLAAGGLFTTLRRRTR